jgi:uncharacterized membrane protein (UPF0136 family)
MRASNVSSQPPAGAARSGAWLRIVMLLLVAEKVVQHVAVTVAFALDFGQIRASVALPYQIFLVAGAAIAVLFALAGWGLLQRRDWARGLIIALALTDIVGEFVAQGTLAIQINVSVLVATLLLILALLYRQPAR